MLQSERLRNAARVNKEAAMECYKAGRFGRAKDKAYVASYFFPELPGLRRLSAVLQVLIGYDKKINGSVDWYAVLGAYPTEDVPAIQKRYRKLFLDMTMDDGESLCGTYKANKILSDSWKFLCNEKGKKLYDKRCRYQLQLRDRQLRSSLFVPVVLSAPKPNISNEQMVQPPPPAPPAFRVSGGERKRKASSSTTVPHVNKGGKNSEDAPKGCLEVLKAFTKEDKKKLKSLVETPKEEDVNGMVGSKKNVASHDDETMN
ncbi:hypothetical protein N665_0793s0002 [Sinapis alba]|nr:hypothetical protein N665_0793s0002 [Sinapis alba]